MVTYEVTAVVEPALVEAYASYMREKHIGDVLATGCFVGAVFERADQQTFRARYQARSQAMVDQYLREHTQRLRDDFAAHFPQGLSFSRAVWHEERRWPESPAGSAP